MKSMAMTKMIATMGRNKGLSSNLLKASILNESFLINKINITEINMGEISPTFFKLKISIWKYLNPVVRIIKAKNKK
ncbi:hypothetical protein JCM18694_35730 [Prolixibacter denitrificans]|uniref:Uncharacterized protein n=1 Tax=Prolixibacter denitrificans TaxID=1541063 RepID=A0ABQ0ZPC3_9BACT|nr:hypothetical protein JCM18694_35730 [Prolixibacter denitrificans]